MDTDPARVVDTEQAVAGRIDVVVRAGTGAFFFAAAGVTGRLVVADGWVVLDGARREAWPIRDVALGRSPSAWTGRGIEVHTPSGRRMVSLVPSLDPAMYLASIVDRRARPLLGVLLGLPVGKG